MLIRVEVKKGKRERLYCDRCRYANGAERERWKGRVRGRFWTKVDKGGDGGCWLWMGFRTKKGYGKVVYEHRQVFAHRFAYCLAHGLEPSQLRSDVYVCHQCDNPPCVNPAHLFLGSLVENVRDGATKGRYLKAMSLEDRTEFVRLLRGGFAIDHLVAKYGRKKLQYHAEKAGFTLSLAGSATATTITPPQFSLIPRTVIDETLNLRRQGLGWKRIAKAAGLSRDTVRYIVKRYG